MIPGYRDKITKNHTEMKTKTYKSRLITSILQVNAISIATNEARLPADKKRMISQEDLFMSLIGLEENALVRIAKELYIKIETI